MVWDCKGLAVSTLFSAFNRCLVKNLGSWRFLRRWLDPFWGILNHREVWHRTWGKNDHSGYRRKKLDSAILPHGSAVRDRTLMKTSILSILTRTQRFWNSWGRFSKLGGQLNTPINLCYEELSGFSKNSWAARFKRWESQPTGWLIRRITSSGSTKRTPLRKCYGYVLL